MDNNASDAIIMAFSAIVFVLALSVAMYAFSQVTAVAEIMLFRSDKTNYYDNIRILNVSEGRLMNDTEEEKKGFYDSVTDTDGIKMTEKLTTRIVGVETIIPTLYRYYKENFCVKIYDDSNVLLQVFDINIEGQVRKAAARIPTVYNQYTPEEKALIKKYNDKDNDYGNGKLYLFEAPWIGSTDRDTKTRIDYYIKGESGYINNTLVDYSTNNLKNYIDRQFRETFVEYMFSGDTVSVGEDEEIETITGSKKEMSKIVITYTLLPN